MKNKLAIGIDIGGTRTKIGLVDLTLGKVLKMNLVPTETQSASVFERAIGNAIEEFKSTAAHAILGVGIGVSGFVFDDGMVDSTYGFMDFMEDYPLAEIVAKNHQLPCKIDNDARLVALGEALYGKGKGCNRVLVLTLGTGLGVGFVVNQKLEDRLPFGHMSGHLSILPNGQKCYCGKTGCLEMLVSATGILKLAQERNRNIKKNTIPLSVEQIFGQSGSKNPESKQLIDDFLEHLGIGISNYINLFAPDCVVLGGGVAKGLKGYLHRLQEINQLGPFKKYKTTISISELEEHSGILGSAALFNE